ncbi:MAG: hypothetical protein J6T15_04785 [Bacilli bacterium]|nr:hypothetical protein [Bacilli bacterium]
MTNLKAKSVLELAKRLNEIDVMLRQLELEYNEIVDEIQERLPSLKEDKNLQKIKRKCRGVLK